MNLSTGKKKSWRIVNNVSWIINEYLCGFESVLSTKALPGNQHLPVTGKQIIIISTKLHLKKKNTPNGYEHARLK